MPVEQRDSTAFGRQMTLQAGDVPGRFVVEVDAMWNCPLVSHGGTMTALAAAAMAKELAAPEQRLRSITAVFPAPVNPGPVQIDVPVLRRGQSVSHLSASVRNVDAEVGHTSVAVFG